MKTIINKLTWIFISLFIFSCEDYVEFNAKDTHQIDASVYFRTPQDFEDALVGTYDVLQWGLYNIMIGDIASDNSLCGGESATDVVGLQKIDDFLHDPENDQLTSIWKFMYEGINRANYILQNIDKLTTSRKDELVAETKFLRAYFYFELVKIFGDVPLLPEKRLSADDSGKYSRTPKAEVYTSIEQDLGAAASALPASQSQKGRVTKYAAYALLGKVLLYQDKFELAASALENVIGVYTLVQDFEDIFLKTGENGAEAVLEIQHTNNSNWWDWGFVPQGTEGNFMVIHHGIRGYNGPTYASGWSFNVPTKDLFDAYESGDSRKAPTLLDIEAWASSTGATFKKGYEHTGYFNNKYIPRAGESGAQLELNYASNYRAIRYADVLLMAAEANARKATPDEPKALGYLNQVRARAFGDTAHNINAAGPALVTAIWNERRLELAMEGHRFFDLVRTGEASSKLPGFVVGKHEVFPIPQQEVDISGLTQNSNY